MKNVLGILALMSTGIVLPDEVLVVEPPVYETDTGIEIQTITAPDGSTGELTTYGTGDNTYQEITIDD